MAKRRVKLSNQLRKAIKECGLTRYRLAKLTGIDESTFSRFMSGEHNLLLSKVDVLADLLELDLTMPKPKRKATPKAKKVKR